MSLRFNRYFWATVCTGLFLAVIFAGLVARFRSQLKSEIRVTIANREASIVQPVAFEPEGSKVDQAGLSDSPNAPLFSQDLGVIDQRVDRQAKVTLWVGLSLIFTVLTVAYLALRRAQLVIAERNERLIRANLELTLAAKASAVGQITSNLIHGLQGSVAGLHAAVSARNQDSEEGACAWEAAAGYTVHMQTIIQDTIALLGDFDRHATYELSGHDLVQIVAQRSKVTVGEKRIGLKVSGGFDRNLDSHRGGLLCLIINNLITNAVGASSPGGEVRVIFRDESEGVSVRVIDRGPGIPIHIRAHLFEPGRTGRPGGSGLGLAISQLLARQIGAYLILEKTDSNGTIFSLTLPAAKTRSIERRREPALAASF